MLTLYDNAAIRAIEADVIAAGADTAQGLMEKAGHAALEVLLRRWPHARTLAVFCGKGNNAGDGYVLARLAKNQGLKVQIYSLFPVEQLSALAQKMAEQCVAAGINITSLNADALTKITADVAIDALLGSGLRDHVEEPFKSVIEALNQMSIPILALDVPSGLDVDSGDVKGAAIKASATITFIGYKQGLFTYHAVAHCGDIECYNLNIPAKFFAKHQSKVQLMNWEDYKPYLPTRTRDAHKGLYGHVLIIGGDYGMGGAVRMAAEAALRVGAGLVSVATRPEHVPVVNCSRPEIMCHRLVTPKDVEVLLKRATVVVIGPGLGQSDWAKELLERVLATDLKIVVDADGLNLLAQHPSSSQRWVLTPHPGEAARLLNTTSMVVQSNRFQSIKELQQRFGGAVVLKGAGSLVLGSSQLIRICPAGNPGMATGGMGDILSGVIGGLLSQNLEMTRAAEIGVLIHAMAGDQAAHQGGERGLLACDLLNHLRLMVNP